jgi:quercetin dioxygenase-like cupin family protein
VNEKEHASAQAKHRMNMEATSMISKYSAIGIIATTVASLAAAPAQSNNVASGHREILLQTTQSWNGKPYTHYPAGQPQLTTIKLTIAPHTVLPWHTHPFPNVVYVLSGTLTLHDKASGKTQVVHQGEAVAESVDDVHRGESGDEPTVLLITYAGSPGVPTSIPAPGEKAEY